MDSMECLAPAQQEPLHPFPDLPSKQSACCKCCAAVGQYPLSVVKARQLLQDCSVALKGWINSAILSTFCSSCFTSTVGLLRQYTSCRCCEFVPVGSVRVAGPLRAKHDDITLLQVQLQQWCCMQMSLVAINQLLWSADADG